MKRIVSALALALGLAGGAQAAVVDGQRFESDATKLAMDFTRGRARHLCICQDGGANQRHVGYLVKSLLGAPGGIRIAMTCQIPTLSSIDRAYVSSENCSTFELLHK